MKITIETDGITSTISEDITTASDALEMAVRCLVAVGFHGDNIRDAVIEMGDVLSRDEPTERDAV